MANQIVWCDIPVLDLDRALKFYSAVLDAEVKKQEFPGMTMAILPLMIYLNAKGRLDEAIAAVLPNGGKVLKPRHAIGPYGSRAIILDSEGNRIALHSD